MILSSFRVILRAPYIGSSFLTKSRYNQMIGRAGRAGIDSSGESILVVHAKDKSKVQAMALGFLAALIHTSFFLNFYRFVFCMIKVLGNKLIFALRHISVPRNLNCHIVENLKEGQCNQRYLIATPNPALFDCLFRQSFLNLRVLFEGRIDTVDSSLGQKIWLIVSWALHGRSVPL